MTHMDAGNAGNAEAVSSKNEKRPILLLASSKIQTEAPMRDFHLVFFWLTLRLY
jgi:hypothetical protein